MGRWADQDSDSERLPEGFKRIGYDADTQRYTFQDGDGVIYESEPGNRYGKLYPVSSNSSFTPTSRPRRTMSDIAAESAMLPEENRESARRMLLEGDHESEKTMLLEGNRESVKMMLPFALLVLSFLLLLIKFLGSSGEEADHDKTPQVQCQAGYRTLEVKDGDTCWDIGKSMDLNVDELLRIVGNEEVDCAALRVGLQLCVPATL